MEKFLFIYALTIIVSCRDIKKNEQSVSAVPEATIEIVDALVQFDKERQLFSVARTDSRSQRVFVVIDSSTVTDIIKISIIIDQVDKKHKFNDNLNISFFSDSSYVGYKDEYGGQTNSPDPNFFLHYVGEYDKKSKEYWTYPSFPKKKVKYILE